MTSLRRWTRSGLNDAWGMRWNPVDGKLYIATRGMVTGIARLDPSHHDLPGGPSVANVPGAYGKTLSLQVECATLDMGDLPDVSGTTGPGNYQTLQQNNGPTHVVGPNLRMGALIDAEFAAHQSPDALGDDEDNLDDEDGILNMPQFVRGQTVNIPVSVYNADRPDHWRPFMDSWTGTPTATSPAPARASA